MRKPEPIPMMIPISWTLMVIDAAYVASIDPHNASMTFSIVGGISPVGTKAAQKLGQNTQRIIFWIKKPALKFFYQLLIINICFNDRFNSYVIFRSLITKIFDI